MLAMSQQDVATASTLHLVASDMTDIMENLDTRELDIGDGEDVFEGPGANSAGERGETQLVRTVRCIIQMFYTPDHKPVHMSRSSFCLISA